MCDCDQTKVFITQAPTTETRELSKVTLNKLEDVGELRQKLSLLEDAVGHLGDEQDRLSSKLQPIRVGDQAGLEKGAASSPSFTELGDRIQVIIDRVRGIAQSLNTLREDVSL